MVKGFSRQKIEQAKRTTLDNLFFYGSSVHTGVAFNGFETLERLLRPKAFSKALDEVKDDLRQTPRTYHFWIAVFFEQDGDIHQDITMVDHHELTLPLLDIWLTGYITDLIDEDGRTCLGYGWVGTPSPHLDLDAETPRLITMFERAGVYRQDKRKEVMDAYYRKQTLRRLKQH